MNKSIPITTIMSLACALSLAGCGGGGGGAGSTVNPAISQEDAAQIAYDRSTVALQGKLLDQSGVAIVGASVTFDTQSETTAADGSFVLTQLPRKNGILSLSMNGMHTESIPVNLSQPDTVNTIMLDTMVMSDKQSSSVRMLFGGDVAFGRRFIDPDESTPRDQVPADDADAMIQVSDPEPGTRNVVQALRPWFQQADFGVINFETPVTGNPSTPHQEKSFAFFTLPGSVPALNWLGVDYVSLGNNHVYDYLEQGLTDTLSHLNNHGIGHSGAGSDPIQAFAAYRTNLNGMSYGFLSMTSVSGSQHSQSYVAEPGKGGAADLREDADVVTAIQGEQTAGYIPIVQYHTGKEYTFEPTAYVLDRMQLAIDNNVPLLITHHPHVAQGIGVFGNTVAILGLGNLAFDQARLETMLGLMARVDMNGNQVEQVRLLPVYLENYAPQLINGRLADNFLRRIGEFSHAYGTLVYPYNGQGWVDLSGDAVRQERSINIDITIPASGETIVDLRAWLKPDESLLEWDSANTLTVDSGRDLFAYGDFEDWDADEEVREAPRWDVSGSSRFVCVSQAYRGSASLCSVRSSTNSSDSVTANRNRIRVMGDAQDTPNKDLTLFGYIKGDNAGPVTIQTRYYASVGSLQFGQENAFTHSGGSFDWQPFSAELNMPAEAAVQPDEVAGELNARALRMFIRQSPPTDGHALAVFDDIAVIGWEDPLSPATEQAVPHARDFLRVGGAPGRHTLSLRFARYVPAALP